MFVLLASYERSSFNHMFKKYKIKDLRKFSWILTYLPE